MPDKINSLLRSLSAGDLWSELEANFKTVELRPGDVLAEAWQPMQRVYFPHSGIVSFLVPLEDGHLVQSGMVGHDGAVGALPALNGKVSSSKIVVRVPGTAAVLDSDPVSEMARAHPRLHSLFMSHEQFFLAEVQQSAACNAVHTVRQRVCRWMLRMNDLVGTNVTVTQESLSEMLGVRRTSVSAAASSLQEAGLIRYRRGHIRIVDIDGLKQSSCECYEAVRGHYERIVNGGS